VTCVSITGHSSAIHISTVCRHIRYFKVFSSACHNSVAVIFLISLETLNLIALFSFFEALSKILKLLCINDWLSLRISRS
jgi:hypothetical protein